MHPSTSPTSPTPTTGGTRTSGGALELYPVESPGTPAVDPSVSLLPKWNSMAFFTVQPGRSFHAVQEVFADGAAPLHLGLVPRGGAPEGSEARDADAAQDARRGRRGRRRRDCGFRAVPVRDPGGHRRRRAGVRGGQGRRRGERGRGGRRGARPRRRRLEILGAVGQPRVPGPGERAEDTREDGGG